VIGRLSHCVIGDLVGEDITPDNPRSERVESETSTAESPFPSEPFACPSCGQMLGPECRVCVACKKPIDPAEIKTPAAGVELPVVELPRMPLERVRFPWGLFSILLLARFVVAATMNEFLGLTRTFLILGTLEIFCGAWVFYDALRRAVPKPLRWGLGSALLWVVFFPWYLARRKTPRAICPFMEAEAGPVARVLLVALMVFFLLSILMGIFKGPQS
jgi:hypothetical protein